MSSIRDAGAAERIACAVAGTWLAIAGIRFIRRALGGHRFSHSDKRTPGNEIVDLASEQSFPATDSPAWNAR